MTDYKNENLSVTLKKEPGCKTTFTIAISPAGTDAAWKKAVKKVKKEVSLPGFRKGKAPDTVITENYKKYVDQEWRDLLIQTAFMEATELTGIHPLDNKHIERPNLKKATLEEGAELEIKFEARPAIPEISFEDLQLEPVKQEPVTDEKVDEIINTIQIHHAEWKEVEPREVAEGDYVDLDIENLQKPGMMIATDTRYHIKEGVTTDWLRNLVLGQKPGDSKEGEIEGEQVIPVSCKVTVKSIKEPKLPEVDEEFIKKTGAESLEDLTAKIRKDLEKQENERVRDLQRSQVEKQLMEKYPFDIPLSLLEYEKNQRTEQLKSNFEQMGLPAEKMQELLAENEKRILQETLEAYRIFFLTRHFANEQQISVSQEEIVREIMERLSTGKLNYQMNQEETQARIQAILLERKVLDFIVEKLI